MAKFWEHLKYHDDNVTKRIITKDEIDFLKDIQHEMNTQDHCGTADPRYWTIRDYKKIYGDNLNNPTGYSIYDSDSCYEVYEGSFDKSEILNALIEHYECDFARCDLDDMGYGKDDLKEFLEDKGYDSLSIIEYQEVEKYCGFFLTEKAARQYLKSNAHHHSENATTYCLYSWRCEQTEKLWKILHEVDFDKLLRMAMLEDDLK